MSELRKQLELAAEQHQSLRYPGDLGADLLGASSMRLDYAKTQRKHWMFWATLGATGAIAATIMLALMHVPANNRMAVKSNLPQLAVKTTETASKSKEEDFTVVPKTSTVSMLSEVSMSAEKGLSVVPKDVSVVPNGETAFSMPAMPSFPSMGEVLDSATDNSTSNNKSNS